MFRTLMVLLGLIINISFLHPQGHLNSSERDKLQKAANLIAGQNHNKQDISFVDSMVVSTFNNPEQKWTAQYEGNLLSSYEGYLYSTRSPSLRIVNKYNENGQLVERIENNWSVSSWVPERKDSLSYDSAGNERSIVSLTYFNGSWINSSLTEMEYNQNNKIVNHLTSKWEGGEWKAALADTSFYETNNICDSIIFYNKENENWIPASTIKYYVNDNQYEYAILKMWDGNIWLNVQKISFTYDQYGNISEFVYYLPSDTNWQLDSRGRYVFKSKGYCLSGIFEIYGNNIWFEGQGHFVVNNPEGFNLGFFGCSRLAVYYKVTSIQDKSETIIHDFNLGNYPNPFNPSTNINYSIKERGLVSLKIYDLLGREVSVLVNEEKDAGNYKVQFNGENLSSGVYITVLKVNNYTTSHKILLMK